jgi:hypothetical protein
LESNVVNKSLMSRVTYPVKHVEFQRILPMRAIAAFAVVGLLLCLGCGGKKDPYARVPISGTVKLDGQMLDRGYLIFEPKSGQPTQSGGMISGGKFEVPREHGPVPGTYSVAIFSGADDPGVVGAGPENPAGAAAAKKLRGERVPRKFNIETTLQREVTADGKNEFDFDLMSK